MDWKNEKYYEQSQYVIEKKDRYQQLRSKARMLLITNGIL